MLIDYNNLRQNTGFRWHCNATVYPYLKAAGLSLHDFNKFPEAGIRAYREGRQLVKDLLGPKFGYAGPSTPPISYGHINTLGVELVIPEGNGEVNHGGFKDTLHEAVEAVAQPVDFTSAGTFPFYHDYYRKLQAAFPDEKIGFGSKAEGPVTTAYTLRRDSFFYDFFDSPELMKEFLALITDSVVAYRKTCRELFNPGAVSGGEVSLADDVAAMLSPDMWPEFVLPYGDKYFTLQNAAARVVHIEDLTENHLAFLEQMKVSLFEPSISPKISPAVLREKTRVPFCWRLPSFTFLNMSIAQIDQFIDNAVNDGASVVFMYITADMLEAEQIPKLHAFVDKLNGIKKQS